MKVIIRSNEDDPYRIGTYLGRNKEVKNVPMVEINQEVFFITGIIVPYSEPLAKMLDTLTPKEQWDLLANIKRFWSDL